MADSGFPVMFTSGLTLIEWKVGHCRMFKVIFILPSLYVCLSISLSSHLWHIQLNSCN